MGARALPFDSAHTDPLSAHERLDEVRFANLTEKVDKIDTRVGGIFKVLGTGGCILLGVLGWSLKTQYEGFQKQLDAVSHIERQINALPKAELPR